MNNIVTDYLMANNTSATVFCEVGVYDWGHCRLKNEIAAGKTVILVEPLPRCADDIENHIANLHNVTVHRVAIADSCGISKIYDEGQSAFIELVRGLAPCHANGYYDSATGRRVMDNEIIQVNTITFDQIDNGNIDVLLIDTEGCEYFVLKYLKSRPLLIAIETSHMNYINPYMHEIDDWMRKNGYAILTKHDADTFYVKDS